ncbi:MAG: HAD family phosphatase [Clostridiales bacterium]|nr:HAD family phosphatase [Clostridiales bacterium]
MDNTTIRLIALDLDDTTLRSDGTLAPETKTAIERAIAEGIEIVVASGRAFTALPKEVVSIPGINYAVTSNGAAVYKLPEGKRVKAYDVPEDAVMKILDIVKPYGEDIAVEAFVDGQPYTSQGHIDDPVKYGSSPAYVGYVQKTRIPVDDIYSFSEENRKNIDSMVVVCPDAEMREEIRAKIAGSAEGVRMTTSVKHLTEIIGSDAGKDSGLKYVCAELGITARETAAVGNADNDIDMIKFAYIGAAVSNSSANCLAAADMIIGSSNDNGTADFINEICDGKIK